MPREEVVNRSCKTEIQIRDATCITFSSCLDRSERTSQVEVKILAARCGILLSTGVNRTFLQFKEGICPVTGLRDQDPLQVLL